MNSIHLLLSAHQAESLHTALPSLDGKYLASPDRSTVIMVKDALHSHRRIPRKVTREVVTTVTTTTTRTVR